MPSSSFYLLLAFVYNNRWVPPWTWHRVEYIDKVLALTASLFHFRPVEFFKNHPMFAALLSPNLIKELMGFKLT